MEVNPEYPVTQAMSHQWPKIVMMILRKYQAVLGEEVVLTPADIIAFHEAFPDDIPTLVANEQPDGLHLRVVSFTEGKRLAAIDERERRERSRYPV